MSSVLQYCAGGFCMIKKWLAVILMGITILLLTACSNKEEKIDPEKAAQEIEEGTVGFEMLGGKIEEAQEVPAEEKKAIRTAFAEYIAAFNAEDLDRYMATVSKNPKGFDYEQDKAELAKIFEQFDDRREAKDVTIVKYSEKEAQVFANLSIERLEHATDAKLTYTGRQVTVFAKEDGKWKVTSVYFIGNDSSAQSQ